MPVLLCHFGLKTLPGSKQSGHLAVGSVSTYSRCSHRCADARMICHLSMELHNVCKQPHPLQPTLCDKNSVASAQRLLPHRVG